MTKVNKKQTLAELICEVEEYLKTLSYSTTRMGTFKRGWKILSEYMSNNSIVIYNSMVCEAFIKNIIGASSYDKLSRIEKDTIRCANILIEYQNTGTIKFRSIIKNYEFKGEIGELILKYLSYRESMGTSKDTLDVNRLYLHRFLEYLKSNYINMLSGIEKHHILGFINSLAFYS